MQGNTRKLIFALASGMLLFPVRSSAQSFNFATIDVPCAACPGGLHGGRLLAESIPPATL